MRTLHLVLPGDPATRTGGYLYDARIVAGLRANGRPVTVHALDDGFPMPEAAALDRAAATLAAIPDGATVVIDGLALGGMPDVVLAETGRLRLIALIHHPLAAETGIDPALRDVLFEQERRALTAMRRVIVTGCATAAALAGYGVAGGRIGVVEPGTDPAPLAIGAAAGQPPMLLCVATLTPRKGHDVLVRALAGLEDLPWRLVCVGSDRRDPATAAALRERIAATGLSGRIELAGEVEAGRLAEAYRRADLFVLASHHEGYGMAFAEALAHGLPVIGTTAGAIPDTVPPDAGLLVPPGDPMALRAALRAALTDRALRDRLAAGSRTARDRLPDWAEAAGRFAQEVDRVDAADADAAEGSFSRGWLALREPYDAAARNPQILRRVRDWQAAIRPVSIADLAAGTGATLRCLAPHLAGDQDWRLLDRDAALLDRVRPLTAAWAAARGWAAAPIEGGLELRGPNGRLRLRTGLRDLADGRPFEFQALDLVTASALLDLVSAAWLDRLAAACAAAGTALLAALNFTGEIDWRPADPDDGRIRLGIGRHQRTDKGFGPALGPAAANHLAAALRGFGYAVALGASDWRFGPADVAIQTALGPGTVLPQRRAAAQEALEIARVMGWNDHRTGFAHYAMGRLSQQSDDRVAQDHFIAADRYFAKAPDTALHRAYVASQLGAFALSHGRGADALALVTPHLNTAARYENAALLATLLMLRAEALEMTGRVAEAQAVRLDSLGWARYGFGADWAVRAKLREVASLNPHKGQL